MTADTVGGVWSYALELAGALPSYGVEVILATMGAPLSSAQRAELAAAGDIELYEGEYRLEWMEEPWPDLDAAGDWLLDLVARVGPDLVHLNGYVHGALGWGVPVVVVGHSCVLSWWAAVRGGEAPSSWDRYREGVARGLSAADLVVSPTRAMLDSLVEFYGPFGEGRVIYNGRDTARYPIGEGEPFILGAGRIWDEAKGLGTLVGVAEGLPWPVYLAGSTGVTGGGGEVGGGVRYLGQLSGVELAGWMGRASIYALPARYEPFGLSALEAGLAGCALVLGDIPSLREVWGDAAIFVPPSDQGALAAELRGLIDDPAQVREMASRAHDRALSYSVERMVESYLGVYREASERWAERGEVSCV